MVQEGNSVMMSKEEFDELLSYKDKWIKREKQGIKREMPEELFGQLRQLSLLCSCGFIRSFYDSEAPKDYEYADSVRVFNFINCAEEVADALLNEDIKGAEGIIYEYVEDVERQEE